MPQSAPKSSTLPTTTYNDGLLTRELIQTGFREVDPNLAYRLVACTVAAEKSGKTHWALTAPGPIAAISTDTGTEEIARKFLGPKRILIAPFQSTKELVEGDNKAEQKKQWGLMKDAFKRIVENPKIRTMVVDTATEMWELCRLAAFGKLSQVMPQHYVEVNSEFTAMVKMAYQRTDLNVIFIHKQKKQYKATSTGKDAWSGRWERAGFGDLPYLVDINLQHYFTRNRVDSEGNPLPGEFGIEVVDSRIEMVNAVGTKLDGDLCTFAFLAEMLFPDTMGTGFWD